ncbi:MAG: hypothetical protein LBT80_06155 [Lactobacillaceae bacterium]|jgi:hypothetical protein|nr:hypothetical protein [Lactobacillaceae bacterium]
MHKRIKQGLLVCGTLGLIASVGGFATQINRVSACNAPNLNQLPVKYDPRPWSIPIRNQHALTGLGQNLCWSYSGNDMLSYAKQKTFGIKSIYSPNYTNYATAVNSISDDVPVSTNNFERVLNGGGHIGSAASLALLGHNPILEKDFRSTDENGVATAEVAENKISKADYEVATAKHDQSFSVSDINRVGYETNQTQHQSHIDELKRAIFQTGSVGYAFDARTVKPGEADGVDGYYSIENAALNIDSDLLSSELYDKFISRDVGINHATLIVGYDDNYAKTKFNPTHQPRHNGAFLVRNSWGADFGDGGYFWVSYEDWFIKESVGATSVKITAPQPGYAQPLRDTSMRNDPFYVDFPNTNFEPDTGMNTNGDIVLSVLFPAKEHNATLTAVAIDTDLANVNYELYLVRGEIEQATDLSNVKTQGQLIKSGFEAQAGVHRRTIKHVKVPAGQSYTLVLIEKARDKSINNKAAQLFVTGAVSVVQPKTALMAYIDQQGKLTWLDMYYVKTRSNVHGSVIDVVPYLFAYSAEK